MIIIILLHPPTLKESSINSLPDHSRLTRTTNLFELVQQQAVGASAIMTDGAFKITHDMTQQGGSIIFKHSRDLYTCIYIY